MVEVLPCNYTVFTEFMINANEATSHSKEPADSEIEVTRKIQGREKPIDWS